MPDVLLERDGEVAVVTLNRPEKLNAWTADMRSRIIEILAGLTRDESCRAIVFTGSGGAFCAGQDLAETATTDPDDHEAAEAWIDGFEDLYRAVRELDQVTIAAVDGVAAGSGFQFAALADLRVGGASARMGQPEVHSGIPSVTGLWVMWGLLGRGKTTEFALTGELVDADEAYRLGLLNRLVEPGRALEQAIALAHRMSRLPSGAVRLTKSRIREIEEADFTEAFASAKEVHREAYATGEPQREMARFLEKRRSR
ncbi:enoyl-CoA hydratase/isomerase family protein [Leucobacter sp. wl10]|uniref:enoyl-CoA hydratase/isomerase family protein n=1 Tax=Leucobacter sp. wl10 TaxID=2304677 RepID=UPI000E5B2B65|nr:enoyl-CoA hydratase/isomerase family protein [Leucobacter sp. wl10]RGE24258.1 enoyl-CoA hydratase/isomerase family protein [Leucobacter sp. wl10]